MDIKSRLAGGSHSSSDLTTVAAEAYAAFPFKFYWMLQHGYVPHVWQAVFHGARTGDQLARYRHLVAGRRGGKTLSAAWEVLFYALHPEQFHLDVHGAVSSRKLWIWVLTKDYPTGFASLQTLLDVMQQTGLAHGKDYRYNKTERRIDFANGTLLQFKTAEDPQSLRGAALDILWMDEAAFITTGDAYTVVSPALADKQGLVITTTTPHGKNWLFDEFFTGRALEDPREFRVQYTSLDNPYFPREEWERYRERYHPIMFRQEFLASFEAMHGIALRGEWLHYWTAGKGDPQGDEYSLQHLIGEDGRYRLKTFMGVDPAVSLADTADSFAMAVIGLTDDNQQGFLLDTYLGRVDFPDQLDLIHEWMLKWRPQLIGVESNAYQRALAQQASRMSGFPGIVPVIAKGQKNERILSMSPLFKIGKVRIHRRNADFIDQWVAFDPEKKNQKDDLLDAVEIALGVAGVLLPMNPHVSLLEEDEIRETDHADIEGLVKEQLRSMMNPRGPYDPEIGDQW
jgi:predicted phage terminase large subunit-like protein